MSATGNVPRGIPSREVPGGAGPDTGPSRTFPRWAIVAFLVLLNLGAMYGQAGWFHSNITDHATPATWIPAVGVALTIELIGVYLAGMAHAALMANQSAGSLLLAAYGIGGVMGALNYSHFGGTLRHPNPAAVTFGLLSAISPWLWRIYSRHVHRAQLGRLGLLDARGVKLGVNRQIWHPIKSIRVRSFAAWEGITSPEDAVRGWELTRERPEAPVSPAPSVARTPAAWVALAQEVKAAEPDLPWPDVARRIGCSDRHLRNCRRQVATTE